MNIDDINILSNSIFIETFKNIFEKTESITKEAENLRPYINKEHMIDSFLLIFDSLDLKNKLQIINNHPDLGDKLKINKGLTKLSQEEQSLSGLNNCVRFIITKTKIKPVIKAFLFDLFHIDSSFIF